MSSSNNLASTNSYGDAFKEHGESPKALHWTNYRSQALRLRILVADLEIEGKTILDAGCGMGDLLPFLYTKSANFTYLGVDIEPQFIKIAKKRYEGEQFKVFDPFTKPLGSFDLVLSSGVMNSNISNWLEARKQMISALFEQATEALAFNMAGGFEPAHTSGRIAYANAQDILDFCKALSPNIKLRYDYHPEDFTITIFK
jgi:SAM-dependent methyltransferase